MAHLELNFSSKALKQNTSITVILPEKKGEIGTVGADTEKYKTLYLLHGLSGDHMSWMRQTAIERYASKCGIAVVMPEVGRSWYADTPYGVNYFTYITQELPEICQSYFRGMSSERAYNYIGGLSMGGYGAVKATLTYPEKYAGCISLSGSFDITRKGRPYLLEEWRALFGFDIDSALELEGSDNDLFELLKRRINEKADLPPIYMWCGTEDSLININREFHAEMKNASLVHRYEESEGDHSWKWWDMHINDGFEYIFGDK